MSSRIGSQAGFQTHAHFQFLPALGSLTRFGCLLLFLSSSFLPTHGELRLLLLVEKVLDELFIIVELHVFRLEEFQRHQVVVKIVSLNIVLDFERVIAYDVANLHSLMLELFLLYLDLIEYFVT